jgi:long-chain acyl-CoA synthetase
VEKIWLDRYPANVNSEIEIDQRTTLIDVFEASFIQYREQPAFYNEGYSLTYADIDQYSRHLAAYFIHTLKLSKGDRLAIMMPNLLQYPLVLVAAFRAGLVVVNVNPRYTARELQHQLMDSGAKVIVLTAEANKSLSEIKGNTDIQHVVVTEEDDLRGEPRLLSKSLSKNVSISSFMSALNTGEKLPFSAISLTGRDIAFLQYTGGTTGVSKGAVLTHANLVANLDQFAHYFSTPLERDEQIAITALPLYHIFGLTVNALYIMKTGGLNVLITQPSDMKGFVSELAKWKFTFITGVNTLFSGLLHTPGFDQLDFSQLVLSIGGGTAILPTVAKKWFEVTGCIMSQGYGLSETSPGVTFTPYDLKAFNASIGLPLPSTDIVLLNEEGEEVSTGMPGELCVKGPQVMRGYWKKEQEGESQYIRDTGYFKTGDMATIDEAGFFRIVDRKKDLILVSGFNVYPNEIEAVVTSIEGVMECACVGVPDDVKGEVVGVFIVKNADSPISENDINSFCKNNLTAYKVPKKITFLDAIPKSAVGKILRKDLKATRCNSSS